MSKYDALRKRWERMQEITEQVHDQLANELGPLLREYGFRGGNFDSFYQSGGDMVVRYTEHWRGESSSHEARIPLSAWEAEDPVAAAREDKKQRQIAAAASERARKLAEIDRLTRELATTATPGDSAHG